MNIETTTISPTTVTAGAESPAVRRWLRRFEIDEIANKLLDATENDVFVSPKDGFDKAVQPILSQFELEIPNIDTYTNIEESPEEGEFSMDIGYTSNTEPVQFYFAYYREDDQLYRIHADVMSAVEFERFQWGLDSKEYDEYFGNYDEPEEPVIDIVLPPQTKFKDVKVDDKVDPLEPDLPHADDDYMIIHSIVTSKDLEEQQ